jgi:hypothetical protein
LLRIDRHRQWTMLLIARMRLLAGEESPRSVEIRGSVDQAATCLWTALDALDAASSAEDTVLAAKDVQVYEQSPTASGSPHIGGRTSPVESGEIDRKMRGRRCRKTEGFCMQDDPHRAGPAARYTRRPYDPQPPPPPGDQNAQ